MKNVVLGVSGGIAAYKACELVGILKKAGCNVDVILTENAERFVSRMTFEVLSGNNVAVGTFERPKTREIEHISLAKKADVFVIAPATANVIGKIAHGIADDMLTTTAMAAERAVKIICPAMNTAMYENPVLQKNLAKLRAAGYIAVEPGEGRLACGDSGKGRLAAVSDIADEVLRRLNSGYSALNGASDLSNNVGDGEPDLNGDPAKGARSLEKNIADEKPDLKSDTADKKPTLENDTEEKRPDLNGDTENEERSRLRSENDFAGKRVLITAGATRENIDGIRYISNNSSGKMGAGLADAALERGAEVTLVAAYTREPIDRNRPRLKVADVKTTADMYVAVLAELPNSDIIIKAAAPADYRPKTAVRNKIKSENPIIEFVKNPDIAKAVGERKTPEQRLIIFNAETENLIENAKKKLKSKNADMVVANDVTKDGAGFDTDTNIVTVITREERIFNLPKLTKREVADRIFDIISELDG
ncbi:MAG: bifunctional phosphopantothenoylcysteine decarboxylase/phosphopantothenate synthase [Clostridiales bacterium]|jgi:phosphopantothenoylcysteine decarboxylase/phosphopantothenate--cysteine ligase|nr:bifunctional phosphopantothenoylcysteine decarboxylase/phosphopantothenate synthase [Clostridiales bacterium]